MFERFTDRARRVLVLAQEEARLLNHSFIGTEHILLGLIHEGEGLAAKALESLGISLEAVREKVEETIGPAGSAPTARRRSRPGRRRCSSCRCGRRSSSATTTSAPSTCSSASSARARASPPRCCISLGADLPRVRQQVIQLLSGYQGGEEASGAGGPQRRSRRPAGSPVLDQFGRNLTQLARDTSSTRSSAATGRSSG